MIDENEIPEHMWRKLMSIVYEVFCEDIKEQQRDFVCEMSLDMEDKIMDLIAFKLEHDEEARLEAAKFFWDSCLDPGEEYYEEKDRK